MTGEAKRVPAEESPGFTGSLGRLGSSGVYGAAGANTTKYPEEQEIAYGAARQIT